MLPVLTSASSPVLLVIVFLPRKMPLKRSNLVLQNSVLILKNRTVAALAFGPGWVILSWWWCSCFNFYGFVGSRAFSGWTSRNRTFGRASDISRKKKQNFAGFSGANSRKNRPISRHFRGKKSQNSRNNRPISGDFRGRKVKIRRKISRDFCGKKSIFEGFSGANS